jgi:hypothetical protein
LVYRRKLNIVKNNIRRTRRTCLQGSLSEWNVASVGYYGRLFSASLLSHLREEIKEIIDGFMVHGRLLEAFVFGVETSEGGRREIHTTE